MKTDKTLVIAFVGIIFIIVVVAVYFFFFRVSTPALQSAELTIWGTYPSGIFEEYFTEYRKVAEKSKITYVQKKTATFEQDLVEALAAGRGPDMWIGDPDLIREHEELIAPVSPLVYTASEFKNTFVDVTHDLYLRKDPKQNVERIIALPLWVDPLVLYWNKERFNAKSIATPPTTWDETLNTSKRLTELDPTRAIRVSGLAFGRTVNIPRFKELFLLLLLQQGGDVQDTDGDVVFGRTIKINDTSTEPTKSALRFYTDFANPGRDSYTWNPSLPVPEELFAKGSLGMMIDYASAYRSVRERNPHLDFALAPTPQLSASHQPKTYARVPAIVLSLQAAKKQIPAWQFARWLTVDRIGEIIAPLNVGPARRSLISAERDHPFASLLGTSSLQAVSAHETKPTDTKAIIYDMIEATASTKLTVGEAVAQAQTKIANLFSINERERSPR